MLPREFPTDKSPMDKDRVGEARLTGPELPPLYPFPLCSLLPLSVGLLSVGKGLGFLAGVIPGFSNVAFRRAALYHEMNDPPACRDLLSWIPLHVSLAVVSS